MLSPVMSYWALSAPCTSRAALLPCQAGHCSTMISPEPFDSLDTVRHKL